MFTLVFQANCGDVLQNKHKSTSKQNKKNEQKNNKQTFVLQT